MGPYVCKKSTKITFAVTDLATAEACNHQKVFNDLERANFEIACSFFRIVTYVYTKFWTCFHYRGINSFLKFRNLAVDLVRGKLCSSSSNNICPFKKYRVP